MTRWLIARHESRKPLTSFPHHGRHFDSSHPGLAWRDIVRPAKGVVQDIPRVGIDDDIGKLRVLAGLDAGGTADRVVPFSADLRGFVDVAVEREAIIHRLVFRGHLGQVFQGWV